MTTLGVSVAAVPSAVSLLEERRRAQSAAASQRVLERVEPRRRRITMLRREGGMAHADDPARVATRIDRLSHVYRDVRPISPAALAAGQPDAMRAAGAILERVIRTRDIVAVEYLEAGTRAARAVGRVNIRDEAGRLAGYGTGSLVSPSLLLTNHHVLPDAGMAGASVVEFNYQDSADGPPPAVRQFDLEPARFYLADEDLDFALVAVKATGQELTEFGYNPLIQSEGKAVVGEFVTIVQHPGGAKKQVALRDNRVVDVLDRFLHYETDTEPGSSGSPVFNDQWEVVALHHASVPAANQAELGGIVNEGVRVSQLLKAIRAQVLPPDAQALVDGLFAATTPPTAPQQVRPVAPAEPAARYAAEAGSLEVTVPLHITLTTSGAGTRWEFLPAESTTPDPDYAGRRGYDVEFLGTGGAPVPLPTLHESLVPLASVNRLATEEPRYVLPYHHFSVVVNRQRRLAFFTAVNIEGSTSCRLKRSSDRWVFDPRVPMAEQTGDEVYRDNALDRGHLVRRLDPAWGPSRAAAAVCVYDTFHFTNCTPQHREFNENQTTWAGLEDYILENAENRDLRLSVFTGPVLAPDDEVYRGVQLPRQFWKVVVMRKQDGSLSVTAYLLSQEALIEGLEAALKDFSYGAYRTFQVTVGRIADMTRLDFGSLGRWDPLERLEGSAKVRPISKLSRIVL